MQAQNNQRQEEPEETEKRHIITAKTIKNSY